MSVICNETTFSLGANEICNSNQSVYFTLGKNLKTVSRGHIFDLLSGSTCHLGGRSQEICVKK